MKQSENIDILTNALVDAQKATKGAEINADNPFYKSKYADLPAVCRASKTALANNGLAISQGCDFEFNPVTGEPIDFLVTMLSHSSGQWIQARQRVKPVKAGGQEMGKEITYARRYGGLAIINNYAVGDPDLDAEAIQGDEKAKKEAARKVGEKKVKKLQSDLDKKKSEDQDDIPFGDVPKMNDKGTKIIDYDVIDKMDPVIQPEELGLGKIKYISEKQRKLLFVKSKDAGWTDEELKAYLDGSHGIQSTKEIPVAQFNEILTYIN